MTTASPPAIEVSERGDSISLSAAGSTYELTVLTHDPTAQIVVVNERFDAVVKAAGSLVHRLPAGLYKVRVRRGASSMGFEDRLVVLDRDQTVDIAPPQFSSPAPIGGSLASDPHVAAREWLDGVVHVSLGTGSKIALLARYAAPAQSKGPLIHPFAGLDLLGADGRLLVDLERAMPKPHVPDTKDPVSICGVKLDPGVYTLRHRLSTGRQLAQSVVASKGWQSTVLLRRSEQDVDRENKLFARCGYLAMLMRRLLDDQSAEPAPIRESKDGPVDEGQMVDVARQGLADGSRLLSGNLYDLFLKDFENPLLGILGGLLLDLEREALGEKFLPEHAALFDGTVKKLREMVGRQHPDVEALSFRCPDAQLAHRGPIHAPPMFYRSWRIILEAAASRHNLVPLELWSQTIASGTMPPYLIWLGGAVRKTRLRQLRKAAADLSSPRVVVAEEPTAPAAGIVFQGLRAPPSPSAGVEGAAPLRAGDFRARAAGPPPAAPAPRLTTKKVPRQQVALEMRVPANALVKLIAGTRFGGHLFAAAKRLAKASPGLAAALGEGASGQAKAAKRASPSAGRSKATARTATKGEPAAGKAVAKKAAAGGKRAGPARKSAAKTAKGGGRAGRSRKGR